MSWSSSWLIKLISFVCISAEVDPDSSTADESRSHAGHLRPFGSSGPFHSVDVVDNFPSTAEFFRRYVSLSRPLKMSQVARQSSAFHKWTDDYFLRTVISLNSSVMVESAKKENRSGVRRWLHFHEFLRIYNSTDQYMVDSVPQEFRADVVLPGPLQCPVIYEKMLGDIVMWMSSGGTASVVHTDSYENIICLYRGQKNFFMVDPSLYAHKVSIDHPEDGYSAIDVDRVDYTKYPGLADVEYYHVSLSAGDCLYVPYEWIHQVRSYDNNVAVNIWWKHGIVDSHIDVSQCFDDTDRHDIDLNLTLDKLTLHLSDADDNHLQTLRSWLEKVVGRGVSEEEFVKLFTNDVDDVSKLSASAVEYHLPLHQVFVTLDKDVDGRVTHGEVHRLTDDDWTEVDGLVAEFDAIIDEYLNLPADDSASHHDNSVDNLYDDDDDVNVAYGSKTEL